MNKKELRKLFPVVNDHIFLDHAGVGPVSINVINVVEKFLFQASNEVTFVYDKWMEGVEDVRKSCANLVGCDNDEIAFVKNTSHGISIVASGLNWKEGDNVVIYEKEFPSNIYPWLSLKDKGVEVKFIKEREDGEINIDDINNIVDSRTRLISISSVQFINGFRVNLERLGDFCSNNNILLFVDAIQSLGVLPMNVKEFNIDFLAADGHKWMLSPEGTGIFYCNKEHSDKLNPTLFGWKSIVNEFEYETVDFNLKRNTLKFEEGSINVMGILALGASLELLQETGIENISNEVQNLGDEIIKNAEERNYRINTSRDKEKRGGIINISGDFDSIAIREKLISKNIMINSRGGGLRIAPHFYNTSDEIKKLFNTLDSIL